jgi:uncharacterized protein (DUF4415 family)
LSSDKKSNKSLAVDDWSDAFVTRSVTELRAQVAKRRARGHAVKPKKVSVTVRFSPEVIDYFRGTGDGWQTRMDDALKRYVVRHSN